MIASLQPLWWLALPVLLLPIWWHMQRRERKKAGLLATARFLPITTPQQQRTPRWQERLLLFIRVLLLLALIAWLAITAMPWRGDTVLAAPDIAADVVAREATAAGLRNFAYERVPPDALVWLSAHQHEFRRSARILIVTRALPMPALLPQFPLPLTVKVLPQASPATPQVRSIVLATTPEREPQWRALITAFGAAGDRFDIATTPGDVTALIIWDREGNPPASWKSPLWWRSDAAPVSALSLEVNGVHLAIADSAQGRIWRSPDWPASEPGAASAIYEVWQQLAQPPLAYPMPSTSLPSNAAAAGNRQQRPSDWLAWTLLALFILERIAAHVRRR